MPERTAEAIRTEIAAERQGLDDDLAGLRIRLRWLVLGPAAIVVMGSGVVVAALIIKQRGARAGIRAGLKTILKLV
jgi:hypothetical protein